MWGLSKGAVMELVYSGAHPEVVVDELSQETVIKRGEPVEVPDDLGARLIEQDTWSQATAQSASAPSSAATAPSTPAAPSEAATAAPTAPSAPSDATTESN